MGLAYILGGCKTHLPPTINHYPIMSDTGAKTKPRSGNECGDTEHLDALTERNIAAGMSPKEVRNVSVRVSLSRPSGLIANSRIVV